MRSALALALSLASFAASADWEGALEIRQGKAPGVEGRLRVKGGRVLLEQSIRGHLLVTIYDQPGARILQLDPRRRTFTERPMPEPKGPPACASLDVEACLWRLGYQKTSRQEALSGHPCTVWEKGAKDRIWKVDDLDELAFLRQETGAVRVQVRSFRVVKQPEAIFEPPAGWKKIGR